MRDEIDHLKFLMQRFDHYYDSVNNKGNAMLVINTFSLGGIAVLYSAFQNDIYWTITLKYIGLFLGILWGLALVLTSLALLPYNKSVSKSLVFFGGIAGLDEVTFLNEISKQRDEALRKDLRSQVYFLAKGLDKKFYRLRCASYIMVASYLILLIAVFNLLINLK